MEDIGHAPTVEKEYEVLRKAVINENLKSIVIKLNLPPTKRISLDDFFEDYLYVVRTSKEWVLAERTAIASVKQMARLL